MILYNWVMEQIEERKRKREALGDGRCETIGRELGRELGEAIGKELGRKLGEARGGELGRKLGEARGRKISEAIGVAIGRELVNREWLEWDARRQAAKAAGEDFAEPNPAEKRNDAAQNDE